MYPTAAELDESALDVVHSVATHVFMKPGTYFPTIRVASQRERNSGTPFAKSLNLGRVRVVVADK
jgi:hypothetical protein